MTLGRLPPVLPYPGIAPGGRLYSVTGDSVGDGTNVTTIRYGPHAHGLTPLWNGQQWVIVQNPEVSIAVAAVSGTAHDVYAYLTPPLSLSLEIGPAWTSTTSRGVGSPVALANGLVCKSGDPTRLLVGSFYADATNQTQDEPRWRFISNYYNAEPRPVAINDSSASWASSTANVWRMAHGDTSLCVKSFVSHPRHWTELTAKLTGFTGSGGHFASAGVGVDSATANSAQVYGGALNPSFTVTVPAHYYGRGGLGLHVFNWLEIADSTVVTWQGMTGSGINVNGMTGFCLN